MPDILHKVGVKASPDGAFQALATREGLSGWWTDDTQGDFNVGGVIKFRFGERGRIDMKVVELDPGKHVCWQVADGPQSWMGTMVTFDLAPADDATIILFKHQGWKESSEFMHACSTKWATFLISLKSLIETGKGAAYPNDLHISVNGD